MKYIQSYFTDIGIKRKSNQDSLALLKADTEKGEVLLAVLCDGMGGHKYGELASKICVTRFATWFRTEFPAILYGELNFDNIKCAWDRLISECNEELVRFGKRNKMDLGSTLTAFLFVEDHYYAAHVGDSRGYLIGNEVVQITHDQSLIASEIEKGLLTEEEAQKDKRANILLECVGITKSVHIEFYEGAISDGNVFLLCSDGFWHKLNNLELKRYLSGDLMKDNKAMRMHLNYLVETVKNRGERDNISAIGILAEISIGQEG